MTLAPLSYYVTNQLTNPVPCTLTDIRTSLRVHCARHRATWDYGDSALRASAETARVAKMKLKPIATLRLFEQCRSYITKKTKNKKQQQQQQQQQQLLVLVCGFWLLGIPEIDMLYVEWPGSLECRATAFESSLLLFLTSSKYWRKRPPSLRPDN